MGEESSQASERDTCGMRVCPARPQRSSVSQTYTPSDIQRSPKPTRARVLRCTGPNALPSAAPRCQLPPATANCDSCFVTFLAIPAVAEFTDKRKCMEWKMAWLALALLGSLAMTSLALPISSAEHEATWTAWKREHNRAYGADEVRPRDKVNALRKLRACGTQQAGAAPARRGPVLLRTRVREGLLTPATKRTAGGEIRRLWTEPRVHPPPQ